jgi:hypothetical protein
MKRFGGSRVGSTSLAGRIHKCGQGGRQLAASGARPPVRVFPCKSRALHLPGPVSIRAGQHFGIFWSTSARMPLRANREALGAFSGPLAPAIPWGIKFRIPGVRRNKASQVHDLS